MVIIYTLQVRKLKVREVDIFGKSHTVESGGTKILWPRCYGPGVHALHQYPVLLSLPATNLSHIHLALLRGAICSNEICRDVSLLDLTEVCRILQKPDFLRLSCYARQASKSCFSVVPKVLLRDRGNCPNSAPKYWVSTRVTFSL